MATITRENIAPLHDKIKVQLNKEDYLPAFEKSLKAYAKNASIPGFRKGMVPTGMLRKMYGQSIFTDEVLRTAGNKIENFVKEEALEIFAQPMVMAGAEPLNLDMNKPEDFEFDFEIGLKPDVSLTALQNGTVLNKYKVAISDKLLDDEVARIQKRYGNVEEMNRVTGPEDIITATALRTDENGTPNEGATAQEIKFVFDRLPAKLQEEWKEVETGAEKILRPIDVTTEEERQTFLRQILKADELAADGYFKIAINKIGILQPKPLDETLYSEVFPQDNITTETEFRDRLKAELSKEFDRMSQERLNNEIFEYLVHNTPITLPANFLKRWLKEGGEKRKTDAQVEQEYPHFDHQLRWTLISDKVIKDNGIYVSKEEVLHNIKGQLLAHFGMQADEDAPWMDSYLAKVSGDEKAMDETFQRLLMDKLFAQLNTQFAIEEKEIEEEEFFKLPDAHAVHHHH